MYIYLYIYIYYNMQIYNIAKSDDQADEYNNVYHKTNKMVSIDIDNQQITYIDFDAENND